MMVFYQTKNKALNFHNYEKKRKILKSKKKIKKKIEFKKKKEKCKSQN